MTASIFSSQESQSSASRRDWLIARYAAIACCIHILEAAFPSPLPGVKPGLANMITLYVFMRHGWQMAAWVVGLRVLASSLLLGTFLGPSFFLSSSGAIAALIGITGCTVLFSPSRLSAIGLSVVAAQLHVVAQLSVAYVWFLPQPALWHLLPILLVMATASGILTGALTNRLLIYSDAQEASKT
ncbi:MAG: Gx transporter family protein [Gammaproteobacteria bacterium]|nr:Gx transporter family protein [Gammaproteobacteria bacterium]